MNELVDLKARTSIGWTAGDTVPVWLPRTAVVIVTAPAAPADRRRITPWPKPTPNPTPRGGRSVRRPRGRANDGNATGNDRGRGRR